MRLVLILSTSLVILLNILQFGSALAEQRLALTYPAPSLTLASPAAPATTGAAELEAADPILLAQTALNNTGLKPEYAALYLEAERQSGTPWQLIAAVHSVETGQSGDTAITSRAGAIGPMQFMPATFRAYANDGSNDGVNTITCVEDAVMTAGMYLAANGAAHGDFKNALYHYNHSNAYVTRTLDLADRIGL